MQQLALAELEATTSLWTSGLLSLDLAAVACHEAFCTKCLLVLCVNLYKSAGNSQTQSLRLASVTATVEVNIDVVLLGNIKQSQGLFYHELQDGAGEILGKVTLVDSNLARTFADIDAGYGALTTAQRISYVFRIHVC